MVDEQDGGGGVGEGQTKRQIVGSLDMSSSLHQTKETHRNVAFFYSSHFTRSRFE